jgi:hypothetical protein
VLDALPSQRFKNNLLKNCLCLVPLLSFPEDEERKIFFPGFDITQPPKSGREENEKIGKKSRSFNKLA